MNKSKKVKEDYYKKRNMMMTIKRKGIDNT